MGKTKYNKTTATGVSLPLPGCLTHAKGAYQQQDSTSTANSLINEDAADMRHEARCCTSEHEDTSKHGARAEMAQHRRHAESSADRPPDLGHACGRRNANRAGGTHAREAVPPPGGAPLQPPTWWAEATHQPRRGAPHQPTSHCPASAETQHARPKDTTAGQTLQATATTNDPRTYKQSKCLLEFPDGLLGEILGGATHDDRSRWPVGGGGCVDGAPV